MQSSPEAHSSTSEHWTHFLNFRELALKKLEEQNWEHALRCIVAAMVSVAPMAPPPALHDRELDKYIEEIASKLTPPSNHSSPKMTEKIKIAHITPFLLDGGGHTSGYLGFFALGNYKKFDIKGYVLEFNGPMLPTEGSSLSASFAPSAIQKIKSLALPIYFFPSHLSFLDKVNMLYQKLVEDQIDIAVVHALPWDVVTPTVALLKPGCQFVYMHVADSRMNLTPFFFNYHLDGVTDLALRCQHASKVSKSNTKFITTFGACDLGTMDAIKAIPYSKEELGLSSHDLLAGTFGAQHKVYTPENPIFLEFLKKLLEKFPKLNYILMGLEIPELNLPQALSLHLGPTLSARVRVLGNRGDFLRILKSLELYIDSFPVGGGGTVHQAMACGKPILVMENDGERTLSLSTLLKTKDAIAHSPDDLLEKGTRALSDSEYRNKLTQSIQEEFEAFLHPQKVLLQHEAFYEKIHAQSI